MHKCAVVHERGVECGERPVVARGVLAEMLADEILPMRDDVGKTLNVVEERRRERGLKKAVNKNEAITGFEQQERSDVFEPGNAGRGLRL